MSCSCCATESNQPEEAESCCSPNFSSVVETDQCLACSSKGKKVDSITLKAMLNVSLTEVRDTPYFFCRTPDCQVVYFSGDGLQSFTKNQIREPVYQKELNNDDVLICYCFNHTPATITAELLNTGQSTVVDEINAGIKAGQCACDIRNPQGSCCLDNVGRLVKQIEQGTKVVA